MTIGVNASASMGRYVFRMYGAGQECLTYTRISEKFKQNEKVERGAQFRKSNHACGSYVETHRMNLATLQYAPCDAVMYGRVVFRAPQLLVHRGREIRRLIFGLRITY